MKQLKEKEKLSEKYKEFIKQFDFEDCMNRMEKMLVEVKANYDKANQNK